MIKEIEEIYKLVSAGLISLTLLSADNFWGRQIFAKHLNPLEPSVHLNVTCMN